MKCTGKKTIVAGLILGVVFALVNFLGIMGGSIGVFVSYISGAWLGDYFLTFGGGESAIGVAILIGLLAGFITALFYCYLICKLYGLFGKSE